MRPSNEHPYVAPDYDHQEYPKVVAYEADGKTPIIANSPEEEAKYTPEPVEEVAPEESKIRVVKGSKK